MEQYINEYENTPTETGFRLDGQTCYRTREKPALWQAREEIRFACENVPTFQGTER